MLCLSWFQFVLVTVGSALGLLLLVVLASLGLSRFVWRTHERRWWQHDQRI